MANNLPDNAVTSRQALDPGLHRGVKFPRAAFTLAGNAARSRGVPVDTSYAELHGYRFKLPCRPILHLHGDQDGAMQVVYTQDLLDALPAGGHIEIVRGAGHFAQVDQPEAIATAILDYLASG